MHWSQLCFSSQLQTYAKAGMSLWLMWCGCGSEHRGMPVNNVTHTDGGCGDSRNQVQKFGAMGVPVI
jgi:ribosomal protein L2